MKKVLALAIVVAVVGLFTLPAMADPTYSNTAYGQEGIDGKDGYTAINAAGHGPTGTAGSTENWKWQTGSGDYSAIYSWDSDAWLVISQHGDSDIDVECDIEMYWSETTANNKIYFHIGNPFTATDPDKTAIVTGTYATNHPMYVGIQFPTAKTIDLATGIVTDAMEGTLDIGGRSISAEKFDVMFLMRFNGGSYLVPTSFGDGSHGTQHNVLWWDTMKVGNLVGSGTMDFLVKVLPDAGQADGNYNLDPVIVTAPVL
jgi:hypothetical protein